MEWLPVKTITVVAVLALGFVLGSTVADSDTKVETQTEVKVIEVPTVKTKIEYRDKIKPFPEECTVALEALPKIIEGDAAQTEAVGNVLLALQDLSTASALNDTDKVNEAVAIVREEKRVLSEVIADRKGAITIYESFLSKCEAAIAASS